MKKSSVAGIILFIFTAITISFFTIAYQGLIILINTGIVIPILRWSDSAIAATHDLGLGLSSLGFIFLFMLLADGLRADPTNEVSEKRRRLVHYIWGSDLYFVIVFVAIFIAWIGIWFFSHIGFVFTLEMFWLGNIPYPDGWPLYQIGITPQMIHLFGVILAYTSLVVIILIAVIPKIIIYRNQRRDILGRTDQKPYEVEANT